MKMIAAFLLVFALATAPASACSECWPATGTCIYSDLWGCISFPTFCLDDYCTRSATVPGRFTVDGAERPRWTREQLAEINSAFLAKDAARLYILVGRFGIHISGATKDGWSFSSYEALGSSRPTDEEVAALKASCRN